MASAKQKLAFKFMVENGGNISKAMRSAGYSANTAKTPQKLTRTKAWQELTGSYFLSDEELLKRHRELFDARRIDGSLDTRIVIKAIDMAYRLRGRYIRA